MTDEEHQELGAWRLAAKLTGAVNEEAACRKTTPEDVLRLIKFLHGQLADERRSAATYRELITAQRGVTADNGTPDSLHAELRDARMLAAQAEQRPRLAEKRAHNAEATYVRDARLRFDAIAERDALQKKLDAALVQIEGIQHAVNILQERLRAAEAVRDDARAASARDLELRRQAILQARREFDRIQGEACFGAHTFVCRDGDCCGLAAPIGDPCSVCGGPSGVVGSAPDVVVTCGRCAAKAKQIALDLRTGKSVEQQFVVAAAVASKEAVALTLKYHYLDGWKKGVLDAIDKLWAAHASSVLINNDKIFELLNILLQNPPTEVP